MKLLIFQPQRNLKKKEEKLLLLDFLLKKPSNNDQKEEIEYVKLPLPKQDPPIRKVLNFVF